tara:strand:- start:1691 stop:2362 length:672 start_codon:yes stop_codon:yes gene_type:complete
MKLIVAPAFYNNGSRYLTRVDQGVSLVDNQKLEAGNAQDATYYYDGTDLVIDSAAVGSGALSIPGGKLAFPATQVASADANTLDDYEEGTFTPSIGDSGLDGSGEGQAYSKQVGRYTKIGNRVFFSLRVAISNLGTMTAGDHTAVMGLPFTSNSATDSHSAVHVGLATSMALGTAGYSVAGRVPTNAAYIALVLWDSTTSLTGLLISEVSVGADLVISGHYEV